MNNIYSVWDKIEKRGDDECWPWLGYTSSGYGRIDIDGVKGVYAHRAAYLTKNPGSIELKDDGSMSQHVLHRCDNPKCCNPRHLFLGSHDDNMADKAAKGRANIWTHSTKTPRAKLTEEDVFCIRIQKKNGATIRALQMLYEVSKSTICGAVYGRHYKDVT